MAKKKAKKKAKKAVKKWVKKVEKKYKTAKVVPPPDNMPEDTRSHADDEIDAGLESGFDAEDDYNIF